MSDIPPDIIKEILGHLPVKSLLRFRCVSKSWRSLIDSKDFIKLHLHHSSKTNSSRAILMNLTRIYYIDLDSFERLDFGNALFGYCVQNSCNGLVLVVYDSENVVLWNPSTRKLNKLPITPVECFVSDEVNFVEERYALGYDSKHDDYKVVRIIQFSACICSMPLLSDTKIYSLKTNSWKRIDDFPYLLPSKIWGVYLNDALHSVVENGSDSQVIMAFNLGKEEHYEVPKPKFSGKSRGLLSVEVLEGCLAAVVSGKRNKSEIWLMKEYGVRESWTKLLCFVPPSSEPCMNLCPLVYSKSGDEVLLSYDGFCFNWYNLRKKTVRGLSSSFGALPLDPRFHAEVCVGSLVSPYSPARMTTEKQKDGQSKKGKDIKKKRDDFLSVGFKLVL